MCIAPREPAPEKLIIPRNVFLGLPIQTQEAGRNQAIHTRGDMLVSGEHSGQVVSRGRRVPFPATKTNIG
jgi:hypothetical protein